jgi:hypothetical protein
MTMCRPERDGHLHCDSVVATSSSSTNNMRSVLLQSVMLAVMLIPTVAAREVSPRKGFKKSLAWFVAFSIWYALALRFLYPHLS